MSPPSQASPDEPTRGRLPALFPVIASIAVLAVTGLSFLPRSNSWWAFDVLRYFPLPFRLGLAILTLLGIGAGWWIGYGPRPRALRANPLLIALLGAVLFGALFHFGKADTGLMGRGSRIIVDLRQGHPPAPDSPVYNALETRLVRSLKGVRSTPTLAEAGLLSQAAGVLAVALVLLILAVRARRPENFRSSLVVVALVLFQPAAQLFFGHVEAWVLPGACALVFLVSCGSAIEGGSLLPASASLAILLALHPLGFLFVPSWLLTLFVSFRTRGYTMEPLAGLAVTVVGGIVAWIVFHGARPQFHLTPAALPALDLLNTAWFLGAPAVVVLVALLASPTGRSGLFARSALPAFLLFVLFAGARLVVRTDLGPARDWDFFAPLGFAITALAAAALTTESGTEIGPAPALALSLFFLVPWVLVESNADRAAARHIAMIEGKPPLDSLVASSYHAAMADRFVYLGQSKLAARAYEEAWLAHNDPTYAWRSGLCYESVGQLESAKSAFREVTRKNPVDWQAWSELGNVLCGLNVFDKAEEALRRAILLNPSAASPRVHLARTLAFLGRERDARIMLESARPLLLRGDPIADQFKVLEKALGPETARETTPGVPRTP